MKAPVRPLIALTLLLCLAGAAQAQTERYAPPAARTHAADGDRPLTGPSTASPAAVIARFLRDRGVNVSEASLVRDGDPSAARNGVVSLRFRQTVAGLSLYGHYAKAAFSSDGELVYLVENLAGSLPVSLAIAGVSEAQALRRALDQLYPGQSVAVGTPRRTQNAVVFARTAFFHAEPRVTRVAFQAADGSIRPGLLVETWSDRQNQLDHTLVGSGGDVLFVERRTNAESYKVFAISPRVSSQTVVEGPAAGASTESPDGWLATGLQNSIHISGNNVSSYLDAKSNNVADSGGVTVADGNFVATADFTEEPSIPVNREVAVQNLFYLNNRVHDILYSHGFTEAAGNFQERNFSDLGLGSDSVNAEAQDGRGENNANFATPADGSNPRMQMYLFTGVGEHEVVVSAGEAAGTYKAFLADFGATLRRSVAGEIVAAADQGGVSTADGCETLTTPVNGRIALVDRGNCTFVVKAANAQAAGAIGLLVANNIGGTDIAGLGGEDRSITIPVLMVSQNDGATLRTAIGVQSTLQKSPTPPLHVDASLDSDVVFHEYGHGLTWRMIGGMSGAIAGALGEGAADVVAMLINGDDRIGEYSASSSVGLRTAPYANYPNTYKAITGQEVHADGEVYAAIMWRLASLMGGTEAARAQLLTYFVDAMNYIPATPGYEDMRAGLLQATPETLHCSVWNAFAAYGVGQGSSAVITRNGVTITESFTVPAACQVS